MFFSLCIPSQVRSSPCTITSLTKVFCDPSTPSFSLQMLLSSSQLPHFPAASMTFTPCFSLCTLNALHFLDHIKSLSVLTSFTPCSFLSSPYGPLLWPLFINQSFPLFSPYKTFCEPIHLPSLFFLHRLSLLLFFCLQHLLFPSWNSLATAQLASTLPATGTLRQAR